MKTTAFFQRLNYVLRLDTPGAGFVGLLRERARRSPARGPRDCSPPCGGCPPKPSAVVVFGLWGRMAGQNDFLPYIARNASFYETATFGRRKVSFCSPFCGLLFCRTRAKLALPAGKKPAAPKPRPPRGGPPNDRDRLPVFAPPARTPAPATPPQSACSRRLSGCPQRPNLSARRRAESPKGKGKEEPRMKRAPPL